MFSKKVKIQIRNRKKKIPDSHEEPKNKGKINFSKKEEKEKFNRHKNNRRFIFWNVIFPITFYISKENSCNGSEN